MGKGLVHTLNGAEFGVVYNPKQIFDIRYGKCIRPPYVENSLWFVTVCQGDRTWQHSPMELRGPDEDHTFLVDEAFAHPTAIDERRRDVEKWRAVAHQVFVGRWCEPFECLWPDVPVYSHTLPNGSVVKYGYCRTQWLRRPDRELWFVSFHDASPAYYPGVSTFIVDASCTTPQFLERMSNDHWKWQYVCLGRLSEGNDVQWKDLNTGTLEGGVVRTHEGIALDSPHLPFEPDDIPARVQSFEDEIASSLRKYQDDHRGIFNRGKQWQRLSQAEQDELAARWREEVCAKELDSKRNRQ